MVDDADEEVRGITFRQALPFLWSLVARHPLVLVGCVLLGLMIAAAEFVSLSLLLPFIAALGIAGGDQLVDAVPIPFLASLVEGDSVVTKVRTIAVAFAIVQVGKSALSYASGRAAAYMETKVEQDLRDRVFGQALALDLAYLQRSHTGRLYATLHSYPHETAKVATKFLSSIPRAATIVSYAAFMLTLSWKLTLLAGVLVLIGASALTGLVSLTRRLAVRINLARERQNQMTLETLQGMKVVRLFGREEHERGRFRDSLARLKDTQYRKGSVEALAAPLHGAINMGLMAAVIILATLLLDRSDEAWLALLTGFMLVLARIMQPATLLVRRRSALANALPAIERVIEFLRTDDKVFLPEGTRTAGRLEDAIRFEGVSFRYRPDLPEVLQGLDVAIPKGKTVALVGGSGAGKSTFVNVLARLHDPTSGRITMDGVDIRDFKTSSYRRRLAVVSQDTFIFKASARENIRYGKLDATDEEVEAAARLANAHEFILGLEDGYDTPLGERGTRLSGGQAQRIAIARAILADPDVLVLDEATSALDAETERQVQEAIRRVASRRTVVAIAHRLSTVQRADEIVVMEKGRVVERGTHRELLARRGRYWTYFDLQRVLVDDVSDAAPESALPAVRDGDPTVASPSSTASVARHSYTCPSCSRRYRLRTLPIAGTRCPRCRAARPPATPR